MSTFTGMDINQFTEGGQVVSDLDHRHGSVLTLSAAVYSGVFPALSGWLIKAPPATRSCTTESFPASRESENEQAESQRATLTEEDS